MDEWMNEWMMKWCKSLDEDEDECGKSYMKSMKKKKMFQSNNDSVKTHFVYN